MMRCLPAFPACFSQISKIPGGLPQGISDMRARDRLIGSLLQIFVQDAGVMRGSLPPPQNHKLLTGSLPPCSRSEFTFDACKIIWISFSVVCQSLLSGPLGRYG